MALVSLQFVGFVALAFILFHVVPQRWKGIVLLLASLVFSFSFSVSSLLILLFVSIANYYLPLVQLGNSENDRLKLIIGIVFNVGALVFFKYLAVPSLAGESGIASPSKLSASNVDGTALAIGLSYYVLQGISYQVDVYRGQIQPKQKINDFVLYLAYFPKLLAGPIESAKGFWGEVSHLRHVNNTTIRRSFALVLLGLVRKLVIADTLLALVPRRALNLPHEYSSLALFIYMLAIVFAIYNDFAGYTDIVRGVTSLFGVRLSRNFKQPFFARNFTELWGRWHVTLSRWLTSYTYLPLTRYFLRTNPNPRRWQVIVIPAFATFLISGLWHNISLGMLMWGAMMGSYVAIERALSLRGKGGSPNEWPIWRKVAGSLLVITLFTISMVPFVVGSSGALPYWLRIISFVGPIEFPARIALMVGFSLTIDGLQQSGRDDLIFLKWPRLAQAAVLSIVILILFLASKEGAGAPFVYQGF